MQMFPIPKMYFFYYTLNITFAVKYKFKDYYQNTNPSNMEDPKDLQMRRNHNLKSKIKSDKKIRHWLAI